MLSFVFLRVVYISSRVITIIYNAYYCMYTIQYTSSVQHRATAHRCIVACGLRFVVCMMKSAMRVVGIMSLLRQGVRSEHALADRSSWFLVSFSASAHSLIA